MSLFEVTKIMFAVISCLLPASLKKQGNEIFKLQKCDVLPKKLIEQFSNPSLALRNIL